ncbi:MAG: glycosyltransferase [Blastocatellia bacterium]
MSQSNAPELTVVVASPYSVYDIKQFLEALHNQNQGGKVEVIVAECCLDGSMEEVITDYPDVSFIRYPERTPLPVLWGDGIARSKGRIIAITDSTCLVGPDWVAAIIEAHRTPHPVIGGAVEATGIKRPLDWAVYFCEYGQFMRPLRSGAASELPGNNISFKRPALETGREFVRNGFWKTHWCRKLQAEGIELVSAPSVVVSYRKSYQLVPFLIRRYHHGRCFAGMRVAQASLSTRVSYAAGCGLLPFLFLARVIGTIFPKKRYLKEFALSLPYIMLAVVSWSFGEFRGYLAGPGKSCAYIY